MVQMVGVWLDVLARVLVNGDYNYRCDELRACVDNMVAEGLLGNADQEMAGKCQGLLHAM